MVGESKRRDVLATATGTGSVVRTAPWGLRFSVVGPLPEGENGYGTENG